MAIAWIKEIHNYHPNTTLAFQIEDSRIPSIDNKESKSFELPQGQLTADKLSNFAVPWSFAGNQHLKITVKGAQTDTFYVEIRGRSGWDYLVFRDAEFRECGEVELGSQGDAPGVNHSWWAICLHSDGKLEWHALERQGLQRDEALALGRFLVDLSEKSVGLIIKAIAAVA
ncbi:hypothetical protein [Chitinilyticum litopenaei]|uniref:hypothetical protein n=1 Tax=Chitinilyticum litopenaei TaxID=1121276 RepID=UPI00042716F5|nr:hypothetical protein [Chitinilyticum litopenaei]